MTFFVDEVAWVMQSPNLGLGDALEPHNGHLILTTRVTYAAILDTFGSGYLPFRLLVTASVLLASTLFFAYARPRVGAAVALAPTLVLLVFGSDATHIIVGNGFTVLLAVAFGLAALILVQTNDRVADLAACGFLCLGIVTYTTALAFVVAVGVFILLRDDRWRRAWIVLLPIALYAAWWLWALAEVDGSESEVVLSNLLALPAWAFQSLGFVLAALVGVGYEFSDSPSSGGVAPTLALISLAAFAWRLRRGSVPPMLWAGVGMFLTLSAMGVLTADPTFRTPDTSRYLYPGAFAVLIIAVEAVAGTRWSRGGLIGLYAFVAIGAAANLTLLRDTSAELREGYVPRVRSQLAGIEIAGPSASSDFNPGSVDPNSALVLVWGTPGLEPSPTEAYLAAAEQYGPIGYSAQELRETSEPWRAEADSILVGALGVVLTPRESQAPATCQRNDGVGDTVTFSIASGTQVVMKNRGLEATLTVARFSDAGIDVGRLAPGRPATLNLPPDHESDPWRLAANTNRVQVCGIR